MRNIAAYISRDRTLALQAETPEAAIRELWKPLAAAEVLAAPGDFLQKVLDRETDGGTGLGMGVAIPHARTSGLRDLTICVGHSIKGIDFLAPDNSLVHLVFLIAAPVCSPSLYLQVVRRISWLIRNEGLREQLYATENLDSLFELLAQH